MTTFLAYTVVGFATGCIYALTASGLVVTYTTSGIFNFAHGAIGMLMAFTFWELTVEHGWPQWLALLVVLGVFAPLLGALIERLIMRRLHGAPESARTIVTLGLLLAFIGLASIRWNPGDARVLPEFFAGHHVRLFSINITYHQLTMMTVTVLASQCALAWAVRNCSEPCLASSPAPLAFRNPLTMARGSAPRTTCRSLVCRRDRL